VDLLLILTYAAICIVIFKVFKIPLNKWTVPTAVLGGLGAHSAHPGRQALLFHSLFRISP